MRPLIVLIALASCADPQIPADRADAVDANLPAPPLLLAALLPDSATATELPTNPTESNLPTMSIVWGGQGYTMVLLNVAARSPWPNALRVSTWLERESDGASLAANTESWAQLAPLGPLWVSAGLAFVVSSPCAASGQALRAHAQVQGAGEAQDLVGRLRLAVQPGCP